MLSCLLLYYYTFIHTLQYIDLDYQGGGTGEYQYYDTTTDTWDTTACDATNNARCAKMDCHLSDSNWQLLGIYKQADWQDWMEQLFKHQGYCLWNNNNDDNKYEFMSNNYNSWPEGCTQTEVYNEDGDLMYYDVKPAGDGNMTVGLYTNAACSVDYTGDIYTPQSFLAADQDGDDDKLDLLVGKYADMWNEAMSVYKVCQPCRASNVLYSQQEDEQQRSRRHHRKLEGDDNNNSPNNGLFQCNDDAGYTGMCFVLSKLASTVTLETKGSGTNI